MHKSLDPALLRRLQQHLRPFDIDLPQHLLCRKSVWRRSMYHHVRPQPLEQFVDELCVGDVAIVVGYLRGGVAVEVGPQVEDRDACRGMALEEEIHDVVAKEAAAACYQYVAERLFAECEIRHCGVWGKH